MRITEFWNLMEDQFGSAYAHSLAVDYRVSLLGCTVDEALRTGIDTKMIWRAVCEEFDIPASRR